MFSYKPPFYTRCTQEVADKTKVDLLLYYYYLFSAELNLQKAFGYKLEKQITAISHKGS
jgi:hypothetical protein